MSIIDEKPLVSIIVPNYNYGRYLDERMASIIGQTYDNYEIIILDDNSTDNSLLVIEKYKSHPKVSKVIVNEHNSGSPFIQWRRGISESKGDIIWIAESDDTCSPFFLESMVPHFYKSNLVLSFCRSVIIDENGIRIRDNNPISRVDGYLEMDGKIFLKKYLCYGNVIQNASSVLFKKSASMLIDDEFMNYKGSGDWLFWIKVSLQGSICYVNDTLNNYRIHKNTTRMLIKNGIEFHEMKQIFEWLFHENHINKKIFKKCRVNSILLIRSIDVIPDNVKDGLYKMWEVSRLELTMIVLVRSCYRFLYSLGNHIKIILKRIFHFA